MGFACGFVGLPNVGKSTLVNALSHGTAAAENFPFCTIEPNTAIVPVPDERLGVLAKIEKSAKIVPTSLKFIDIAGLVEGASKGEGLGNQFLGHIRGVDCVVHVVRLFGDGDVVHVKDSVDPSRDLEIILTELMLADLDFLQRAIEKVRKAARGGDPDLKAEVEVADQILASLEQGKLPEIDRTDERAMHIINQLQLLTTLPAFVVANVDEEGFRNFGKDDKSKKLIETAAGYHLEVVPVCAKLEQELGELSAEEAEMFLADLGATESGLQRVIKTGYRLLNYLTFFTAGPTETRAWTVAAGSPAPVAAGKIHTDMQRGFIRMEVVPYEAMVQYNGWNAAKNAGKLRVEGKEYVVQDGDCVFIRFAV